MNTTAKELHKEAQETIDRFFCKSDAPSLSDNQFKRVRYTDRLDHAIETAHARELWKLSQRYTDAAADLTSLATRLIRLEGLDYAMSVLERDDKHKDMRVLEYERCVIVGDEFYDANKCKATHEFNDLYARISVEYILSEL